MSIISIQPTFPNFAETDGTPLEAGFIYIGTTALNPETNPITVYWDFAQTIPASQPIRTIGGRPSRSGSAARIFIDGDYSMTVRDRNNVLVYSALSHAETLIASLADLANTADVAKGDALVGVLNPGTGGSARTQHSKNLDTVSVNDFGGGAGGDVGAEFNAAALHCNTNNLRLHIPGRAYSSSISLDWSTYTNLEVVGDGHHASVITFTNDVLGINFGGKHLEGVGVIGIGGAATKSGIEYTSVQRKFVQAVSSEGFNDGQVYKEGNLSYFNFIFAVSNNNHGFLCDASSTDNNAATVGMMDLRGNGGDGLHMTTGTPPNVCQQMYGGLIVSQNNTGNAANISGRGHKLSIYDESNGGGVILDANSEGCEVTVVFGTATDSGSLNDVIEARVGSVEAWVHTNLQARSLDLRDRSFAGSFHFTHPATRHLQIEMQGSGSDGNITIVHPTAGSSLNLSVDGRINGKKEANVDLATSINVSGFNLLELTNSVATNITGITSGTESQELTLVFMDGNTTIVSGAALRLAGGANFVGSNFDTLKLVYNNPDWHEISRSVNA